MEGKYNACLPSEKYRDLGPMVRDKMDCLKQAIKQLEEEQWKPAQSAKNH